DKYHPDTEQSGWNLRSIGPDHAKEADDSVLFSGGQKRAVPRVSDCEQHNTALYGPASNVLFRKSEIKETGIKFACMLHVYRYWIRACRPLFYSDTLVTHF